MSQLPTRPSDILGLRGADPIIRLTWDLAIVSEIDYEGMVDEASGLGGSAASKVKGTYKRLNIPHGVKRP